MPTPTNAPEYPAAPGNSDTKSSSDRFLSLLQAEASTFNNALATGSGEWIVKGFVDVFRNVYTISADTKVISKLIELMLFPVFIEFASRNNLHFVLAREQNHYPDLTFINDSDEKFAVDLKSTYRTNEKSVNGMTLGAFTGYFRDRNSSKNTTFPYSSYTGHFVLGVIYSRIESNPDEMKRFTIEELESIPSVVRDFKFFVQPKYRIAIDRPGSGNTKNIGSVNSISQLTEGTGPFSEFDESVFDDYWMYYLTADMARTVELVKPPYSNLKTYFDYKESRGII